MSGDLKLNRNGIETSKSETRETQNKEAVGSYKEDENFRENYLS